MEHLVVVKTHPELEPPANPKSECLLAGLEVSFERKITPEMHQLSRTVLPIFGCGG